MCEKPITSIQWLSCQGAGGCDDLHLPPRQCRRSSKRLCWSAFSDESICKYLLEFHISWTLHYSGTNLSRSGHLIPLHEVRLSFRHVAYHYYDYDHHYDQYYHHHYDHYHHHHHHHHYQHLIIIIIIISNSHWGYWALMRMKMHPEPLADTHASSPLRNLYQRLILWWWCWWWWWWRSLTFVPSNAESNVLLAGEVHCHSWHRTF